MHVLDLLDDVEANFSHHVTKLTNLNDEHGQDHNEEDNEEEEDTFASKPSSRGPSSRPSLVWLRESIHEGWRFFFEFSVDDTTPHGALLYRRALTFLCLLVTVTMGTHQAFDLLCKFKSFEQAGSGHLYCIAVVDNAVVCVFLPCNSQHPGSFKSRPSMVTSPTLGLLG